MATSRATATSARSPPDSSESRLIFLPGGRASTSMPVVRVGQNQPALTSGEQPAENALELGRRVVIGLGEDLLDTFVDLTDDVHEIALGVLEVLELLGQELVAFLERGILLQCQGVDAAEGGELALG